MKLSLYPKSQPCQNVCITYIVVIIADYLWTLFSECGYQTVENEYVQRRTVNKKEGIDVPRIFVQGKFVKPEWHGYSCRYFYCQHYGFSFCILMDGKSSHFWGKRRSLEFAKLGSVGDLTQNLTQNWVKGVWLETHTLFMTWPLKQYPVSYLHYNYFPSSHQC